MRFFFLFLAFDPRTGMSTPFSMRCSGSAYLGLAPGSSEKWRRTPVKVFRHMDSNAGTHLYLKLLTNENPADVS